MIVIVLKVVGWLLKFVVFIFYRNRFVFGFLRDDIFCFVCCWCGFVVKCRDVYGDDGVNFRSFSIEDEF